MDRAEWLAECRRDVSHFKKVKSGIFSTGEVHVYRVDGVEESFGSLATKGCQSMIDDIGLAFRARYMGSHEELDRLVLERIEGSVIKGSWGAAKRFRMLMGIEHTLMVVVPAFTGLDPEVRGDASTNQDGILYFPKERGPETYVVDRVAKHEMGHVLSLPDHINGETTEGYGPYRGCVMTQYFDGDDSYHICDRCLDGFRAFWKEMERQTGRKFFR